MDKTNDETEQTTHTKSGLAIPLGLVALLVMIVALNAC